MNFLAHLFLSGKNEEVMVGNLLEDFVVGKINHPRNEIYNYKIKNGILLHRFIDTFTDTNCAVSDCKVVLYEKYHKYASVLIDIFFDHYLAIHWIDYSNEPFDKFRYRVHIAFQNHWSILPEKMKPMIESMIKNDWLNHYSEFWGIERALIGISKRTKYESNMEKATEDLMTNYQFFDEKFSIFFPNIVLECNQFLSEKGYDLI